MSDDITEIHDQCSAILEKLYDDKGQPEELDEAFIQEYFTLVQGCLNLDVEEGEEGDEVEGEEGGPDAFAARGPRQTSAKLSQQDRGLVDVFIASKKEKFVVSRLASVRTLSGTSQRFGSSRGSGTYVMTNVKGIPNITIKTGSAIVTFIGLPNRVQGESGRGAWERA